jgi:hypothetical protein
MLKNKVLRKTFKLKRVAVIGSCRKLHNVELCDLYSSPNAVQGIKSGRLSWVGHVEEQCKQGFAWDT